MKSDGSSEIFVVPAEVFNLLDPVEKIVIRMQAARGEVRILGAPQQVISS